MSGWIDRFTRTDEAMVYAAVIAPNRIALEARWNEAAAAYDAVRARFPNHPQIRYRIAQMRFRKGELEGLEQEFAAVADAKDAPNWLRASALLQLGACTTLPAIAPTRRKPPSESSTSTSTKAHRGRRRWGW